MSDLHVLFLKNGIKHISSESFRDNARVQMENLKVIIRTVFTGPTQMKNLTNSLHKHNFFFLGKPAPQDNHP